MVGAWSEMISREEYEQWMLHGDSSGFESQQLIDTLLEHVGALQDRIDKLLEPHTHDVIHGRNCECWDTQCACAYDYPTDVCSVHKEQNA